jgi:hypothetical protein
MTLRLDRDGKVVFDDFRGRCTPQQLAEVARALGAVAHQRWEREKELRSYRSRAEPDITILRTRNDVWLHIGLWAEDAGEFTVIEISDVTPDGIGD